MADYTLSAKITGDSSGFSKACTNAQKTLANFRIILRISEAKFRTWVTG